MHAQPRQLARAAACLAIYAVTALTGCSLFDSSYTTGVVPPTPPEPEIVVTNSASPALSLTAAIDAVTLQLDKVNQAIKDAQSDASLDPRRASPALLRQSRLNLHEERWLAVQRAAAHHGTMHRDAFYGSRGYWHTASTRGLTFALDEDTDLNEPFYIDGRGNIRVRGDVNADIEINGSATVHILGDLNAKLELSGVCEVIIGGSIGPDARIVCDGQLELFVGGDMAGTVRCTRSAVCIIDGNATGTFRCGSPATRLTITGDLSAAITPPAEDGGVLGLRVDGFASTATMMQLSTVGFTRVNATLGRSNAPAGLYPDQDTPNARPTTRWVVLEQGQPGQ